ncbi:MAG: GspH/FimT family pseudopilin [Magnetococcales bacterium]|nr:GspH/FimT family pseudopilin [Magnetococcales bacterium]MBF0149580.1 GspH/FimT family pseudopilin [Magnetococcales bacterium]
MSYSMATTDTGEQGDRAGGPGGYTLVEMLVVLAIVAILVSGAVPFLSSMINNNRLTAQFNQLVGTLQFARSEAIRRQTSVTVCSSNDGASCGGNWQDGWIVLAQGAVVKSSPGLPDNTTLRFNLSSGAANDRILFDSRGFSINYAGFWTLCDARGVNDARGILVASTGRVINARDANHNGIVEDTGGSDLSCP